jgi:hypothetical protein
VINWLWVLFGVILTKKGPVTRSSGPKLSLVLPLPEPLTRKFASSLAVPPVEKPPPPLMVTPVARVTELA